MSVLRDCPTCSCMRGCLCSQCFYLNMCDVCRRQSELDLDELKNRLADEADRDMLRYLKRRSVERFKRDEDWY